MQLDERDVAGSGEDLPSIPVYPMLRWLIPVHALLPLLIGAAFRHGGELGAQLVSWLWLALHVGFPIFLALSYPWWRGRGDEVAAVIVINHIVTIVVGVALISWWPASW